MADTPHPKIARADHEILDVIRHRWSPRAFDVTREISVADTRRLFEAARWAPSSRNEQPWRFVVADRRRAPGAHAKLLDALTPKNRLWAQSAAVLVVVAVRLTHERDEIVNSHAWYDAGQAVALLSLQATAMGLATRQMQGFDPASVRVACDVPAAFEPAVVIAVGHEGDPASLVVDVHRAAETAPRDRRAIDQFVFDSTWGKPFLGTES
jgi:nitroreductase